MYRYLICFYFLLAAASCKKKEEPATTTPVSQPPTDMQFELLGVKDVDVYENDSAKLTVNIGLMAGKADTVRLTTTGFPEKVKAKFSVTTDTAAFSSVLNVKVPYGVPEGVYPVVVQAASAHGVIRDTFNLKVKKAIDCLTYMAGNYGGKKKAQGSYYPHTSSVTLDVSRAKGIYIDNILPWGTMPATLDCVTGIITIGEHIENDSESDRRTIAGGRLVTRDSMSA